ncbi:TRAFAC clade GTPase domain-containing protein [Thermopirellula anaerolimosa]
MIKSAVLPLESYRLAEYAVPVACYVCGEQNHFDAEYCRLCSAPMALAHQLLANKAEPRVALILGPSGVGKTVYLGMLIDMLSRQPQRVQLLARGAFSIAVQQSTVAALAKGRFPGKTPNEPDRWHWVHCQLRRRRRRVASDLILPDMAGEAILQEAEHPNTYHVIRSLLKRCSSVMLLVDSVRVRNGNRQDEFFAMKLASCLSESAGDPKHGWNRKPFALVFTKADQCEECLENPEEFARTHAGGLLRLIHERFPLTGIFASAVAGACAWRITADGIREHVPLRIEPQGIVEPFLWLLEHMRI